MKSRQVWFALMLVFVAAATIQAQLVSGATTSCNVRFGSVPDRQFAAQGYETEPLHDWKEFKTNGPLPPDIGAIAEVWFLPDQKMFVTIDEPGEDFEPSYSYCFDSGGKLLSLIADFETEWGWGHKFAATVGIGSVLKTTMSYFYSTDTEKQIPRPTEANGVKRAMNPEIYFNKKGLPFANLLP
jgi:hypothetical protein